MPVEFNAEKCGMVSSMKQIWPRLMEGFPGTVLSRDAKSRSVI